MRAGRGARAGTKAGRIVRIVRILRLVRIMKLYKHSQTAIQIREEKERIREEKEKEEAERRNSVERRLSLTSKSPGGSNRVVKNSPAKNFPAVSERAFDNVNLKLKKESSDVIPQL